MVGNASASMHFSCVEYAKAAAAKADSYRLGNSEGSGDSIKSKAKRCIAFLHYGISKGISMKLVHDAKVVRYDDVVIYYDA